LEGLALEIIIKLVFLGLDSAGKTTILNILAKRYSFISNVAPTRSIERHVTEVFGYNIVNWDIPGQQQYREDLTFKDIRTLRDASILIFVLDVQALERTHTAIDYIQRVLEKIIEEKLERPYLSVFIHKMDPDIQENVKILKNAKRIQDEINQIAAGFNLDFFLTTMFL
jgi:small GTP-binding protein